ncbi:FAD-binding domain-containing protein [Auriculariales sp. MPI-PUGE-AT-0066]|nr:FAD-binding domain-containing protein [Auriculariales sp. MPI-PUGE-AT-0066]
MSYTVPAAFSSAFTGDIATPADGAAYEAALERWAANAERKAAIIVFPKTAQDIALTLKHIDLPLAIKCGGHSASGASSSEGLVIDLSRHLGGVRVDAAAKRAYVGGGAVWKTVDEEAIKHGLATVGGTVNHTGVGGLTLGGGYGWLSGRHGLAIDNLISATVVTASGDIVECSGTSNPDLFDGIRGGGSNFGVISEFVFQLHPQRPTVYAGPLIFARTPEILTKLKALLKEYWATAGEDDGAILFLATPPDTGTAIIVLVVFHNGTKEAGEARFKEFIDLGPVVNQATEIPYEVVNSLQNHLAGFGFNRYMKGIGLDVNALLAPEDDRLERASEAQAGHGPVAAVGLEFFPLKVIQARDPEGRCAFNGRATCNALTMVTWPKAAVPVAQAAPGIAKALADLMHDPTSVEYANYDTDNSIEVDQARVRRVFGSSYPRFQQLKAKYDPASRFNRWFPITPAAA